MGRLKDKRIAKQIAKNIELGLVIEQAPKLDSDPVGQVGEVGIKGFFDIDARSPEVETESKPKKKAKKDSQ